MRVYTSNYRNHWLSPYVILEKVLYWKTDIYDKDPPKWLQTICEWNQNFLDFIHPRINYIKIDKYDAWNADGTLSMIILPLLQELRSQKSGSPFTDDEDVPDHLKSCYAPRVENEWDTDENFHKRWDWVLDEIIWTFEQLHPDYCWEEQYRTRVLDVDFVKGENGISEMVRGPNDTYQCDYDAMRIHQKRINNGLRLFGLHYLNLWS